MGFRGILILVLFPLLHSSPNKQYKFNTSLNELCSKDNTTLNDRASNTVELDDNPERSAVVISEFWTSSTFRTFNQCQFNVRSRSRWMHGPSSGIFVAISGLNLRMLKQNECLDYVILEYGDKSHKICGTVTGDDVLKPQNFFEIPDGVVNVTVKINHEQNLADNEGIGLKLTITAFEDCNGSYKFRCNHHRCISTNFVDDGIINCIPPLCADEPSINQKCSADASYHTSHLVAIGGLSSLVMFLFVSVLCWYCFKLHNRMTSNQTNNSNVDNGPSAPNDDIGFQTIQMASVSDVRLTTESESEVNVDKPPSYESLFSKNDE